ncbi:MAG: acyl-CoA dehydrogenase family protein [Candidatus Eremiobacteraeota bacterium]|nr:acyl-CoA dehydrogenase family protein [Candidatus Eremiobacteraeota bacterium]
MRIDTTPVRAFLEPRHHELAEELELFAAAQTDLPNLHDDDEARRQARVWLERLGKAGLIAQGVGNPDMRAVCLIRETLGAISTLADSVYALQCLGSMPIMLAGNEQQKELLDSVREGKSMAAFAMTEAEAGSDVVSMKTSARPHEDGFVLEGEKCFITNAGLADFYTVFAKTDAMAGHRGLSCFLVPADTPGLRFVGPQVMSAPHPLGRIAFEHCRLPASSLIGELGQGFKLGMMTLDYMRSTVGAAACGMAARALAEATHHVRARRQFGKALVEFQLVQHSLAGMAIDLTASRLMVYRAVWEKDGGAERVTLESAMAKAYACEAAQRVVDEAIQLHGGAGVMRDSVVDHLYRSVRALRIYEGATDIQHLVIARELLK